MKTVNIISAYHIDVFCDRNDPVDIKCGGSPTLGYDFYVSTDKTKKHYLELMKTLLKKYNRHYENISITKITDFREDKLWTEEKMEECIKNINPTS